MAEKFVWFLPFLYPAVFWFVVLCFLVAHMVRGAKTYRINTLWLTGAVTAVFMFGLGVLYALMPHLRVLSSLIAFYLCHHM
jgi:hypothetical protein